MNIKSLMVALGITAQILGFATHAKAADHAGTIADPLPPVHWMCSFSPAGFCNPAPSSTPKTGYIVTSLVTVSAPQPCASGTTTLYVVTHAYATKPGSSEQLSPGAPGMYSANGKNVIWPYCVSADAMATDGLTAAVAQGFGTQDKPLYELAMDVATSTPNFQSVVGAICGDKPPYGSPIAVSKPYQTCSAKWEIRIGQPPYGVMANVASTTEQCPLGTIEIAYYNNPTDAQFATYKTTTLTVANATTPVSGAQLPTIQPRKCLFNTAANALILQKWKSAKYDWLYQGS